MKLLACILAALPLCGATLTLAGPGSAAPGSTVSLALNASGDAAGTDAAGFQWSIGMPAAYTATAGTGPAAATAGKDKFTCTANGATCVLVGMNTNIVANGILAIYSVKLPANATGSVSFPLSGLFAASPTGTPVPLNPGPLYSLTITGAASKYDLNGDGRVDDLDVAAMAVEVVAARTNPSACQHDVNADGACTVLDVQLVVNKVLGLIP